MVLHCMPISMYLTSLVHDISQVSGAEFTGVNNSVVQTKMLDSFKNIISDYSYLRTKHLSSYGELSCGWHSIHCVSKMLQNSKNAF